jgi:peptidoglycan/xylan/chitin deacetylase (PgdA/CDA1 family)
MKFVLNFHGIGVSEKTLDQGESKVWIDQEFFCEILDEFGQDQDIVLTFDDGNESDYTIAFEELVKRNLKGKFFIIANKIDQPYYLDSTQVLELHKSGMEIGSHGMNHVCWRNLDANILVDEINGSKKILEDMLSSPVTEAACPFGGYDKKSIKALRNAGYVNIYTSDGYVEEYDNYVISRYSIKNNNVIKDIHDLKNRRKGFLDHLKLWYKRNR